MKKLSDIATAQERRQSLEENGGISLNAVGSALSTSDEKNAHCENMIGAISIPLGIAGPISIINEKKEIKNAYIPLATTEGALVASVSRGCKAVTTAGGANTYVEHIGTTRGPVFETAGLAQSVAFKKWLEIHEAEITQTANETSSHLKYLKIDIQIIGRLVYLRLYFDTDQAMGMNMVTIATNAICAFIEANTDAICISIAGNFDVDKKPAWMNSIAGRGRKIWADVQINQDIVCEILKTTPSELYEVWLSKCMVGSAISGSMGFNCHFANIVAAFFAATGQDLAHVVEGSMGITTTKVLPNGALYMSVYLPSIMVGMIGGGTHLETQFQARQITGTKTTDELAQVLAAAVLAGELSLLASLAEGSLSKVHKKLGR